MEQTTLQTPIQTDFGTDCQTNQSVTSIKQCICVDLTAWAPKHLSPSRRWQKKKKKMIQTHTLLLNGSSKRNRNREMVNCSKREQTYKLITGKLWNALSQRPTSKGSITCSFCKFLFMFRKVICMGNQKGSLVGSQSFITPVELQKAGQSFVTPDVGYYSCWRDYEMLSIWCNNDGVTMKITYCKSRTRHFFSTSYKPYTSV